MMSSVLASNFARKESLRIKMRVATVATAILVTALFWSAASVGGGFYDQFHIKTFQHLALMVVASERATAI